MRRASTGKQKIIVNSVAVLSIDTSHNPETSESQADVFMPEGVKVSVVYNPNNRKISVTLGAAGEEPVISLMIKRDGMSIRVVQDSSENEISPDIPHQED